jgi:NADPH-dependent 2,4-dienoyl-CoA reductase/sulfur reductase-like enzyme
MSAMRTLTVDAVVIGAGPAGVAAAAGLKRCGVSQVLVLERAPCIGGVPARYTAGDVATFLQLPVPRLVSGATYARKLERDLRQCGAETHLESTVISVDLDARVLRVLSPDRGRYEVQARAILFACGAREKTAVEQGWIYGRRPARVYNSMPMLDLMRHGLRPVTARVVLIGSWPAAYAMGAKLATRRQSGDDCTMLDHSPRNRTFLLGRLYFARWTRPRRCVIPGSIEIRGDRAVEAVAEVSGSRLPVPADYLLLPGDLVPNSELLAASGVRIELPSWRLNADEIARLAAGGVFLCGNICGGEHGAHRASIHGTFIASAAARYLGLYQ